MKYDPTYLELINSCHKPYFEVSESGVILLANEALVQLVGDAVGKNIYDLLDGLANEIGIDGLSQIIVEGKHQEVPFRLHLPGQEALSVRLCLSPAQHNDINGSDCFRGWLYGIQEESQLDNGLIEAEQVLARQADELAILNHLAVAISSTLDLNEILNSICKEMVNVFNARNTGIAILNESQTKLQVVAFHTEHPEESDVTGLEFSLAGNDASLFVIKTGEPIVVPDAQFNPITRSLHEVMIQRETSCLLVVPLLARGDVIGTIGIPSDSQAVFSRKEVQLAQTIAGQIASVIDNARLHQTVEKARDIAERELEIGRQIQTGFFPESMPQVPGWELFSYFQSARQVAGDFYDAFPVDENKRLALVLADVCDKGVGAALFMVLFRSLLRANVQQCFDKNNGPNIIPKEAIITAVRKTNNYIAINHDQANMFATVFLVLLEQEKDEVWYINCGHDAPVIIRSDGRKERLMPTNPAIGMFPDIQLECKSICLQSGDSLFAFTDGVSDARSSSDDQFGEERILEILSKQISLKNRLDSLVKTLLQHTSGVDQYDDITCIAFNRS